MEDMVEKVAKAMFEAQGRIKSGLVKPLLWSDMGPYEQSIWLDVARAAIEAMMDAEPTEEMMSAMWSLRLTNTRESFATCWRSLLRAYLSLNNQDGR